MMDRKASDGGAISKDESFIVPLARHGYRVFELRSRGNLEIKYRSYKPFSAVPACEGYFQEGPVGRMRVDRIRPVKEV